MSFEWLKLSHHIPEDKKLLSFSVAQKWAWICLLCTASQNTERGSVLDDSDDMSIYCGFSNVQDYQFFLDKLRQKGMIEPINGGFKIANWEKRQYAKPSDMPEATKERKRRQRAKDKNSNELMSREVTRVSRGCHATDKDKDKDKDKERDPITHADPYRSDAGKSADADACALVDCLETDLKSEPEQATPLAQTISESALSVQSELTGEGELSAACSTNLHGTTKRFNDSWDCSSDIAPTTDEIIRLYNIGKPDNWTGIAGDSRRVRRKIQDMALKYQGMGGKLDELPELMKNALLFYRSSDFHTRKEFGSGDIFWLCEQERVEIAAAKWAGSGESAKRKVATAILERENGIPHWRTGKIMSGYMADAMRRTIPKMRLDHTDRPPLDWIKKYMPEILNELDHEYN